VTEKKFRSNISKFSISLTQTDRKEKKLATFHFTEKKIKEQKLFFSAKICDESFQQS